MNQTWRLLRTGEDRGAENMAFDEALLQGVASGNSPPVLRLYRWRPAAVSLGYAQRADGAVRVDACRKAGVDVIRRISGGRAVFHHREVTYAVVAPLAGPFAGPARDGYRLIALALQEALGTLGLKTDLAPGRDNSSSGVCFAAPSRYELAVEGRKVTGSAQKRVRNAFLQHGSIPLEFDRSLFCQIFSGGGDEEVLEKVGWVNRWLRPGVSVERMEKAVEQGFRKVLSADLVEDSPRPEEIQRSKALLEDRYGLDAWTFR